MAGGRGLFFQVLSIDTLENKYVQRKKHHSPNPSPVNENDVIRDIDASTKMLYRLR